MMRKNQKGQIFSLDLLLALTALIVCIGLVLQTYELTSYDAKESMIWQKLNLTGQAAAERLVTDEDIACDLGVNGFETVNCLDSTKLGRIDKSALGIPADYGCRIEGVSIANCNDSLPAEAANVFSITRAVLVESSLNKTALYSCIYGATCNLEPKEITVSLWRK
jgi:hypothetical protein